MHEWIGCERVLVREEIERVSETEYGCRLCGSQFAAPVRCMRMLAVFPKVYGRLRSTGVCVSVSLAARLKLIPERSSGGTAHMRRSAKKKQNTYHQRSSVTVSALLCRPSAYFGSEEPKKYEM